MENFSTFYTQTLKYLSDFSRWQEWVYQVGNSFSVGVSCLPFCYAMKTPPGQEKYDNMNRPIETGLWINATEFVTHLSNAYNSTAYPSTSSGYEQLSITHYDDYTGLPGGLTSTFDATWSAYFSSTYNTTPLYAQQQAASVQTKGIATWTQTKILGTAGTFLYTANIYDEKGRIIQVKSTGPGNR